MAKEFMLYIRNEGDAKAALTQGEQLAFIKQCEVYIDQLKAKKSLVAAQPVIREGCVLKKLQAGGRIRLSTQLKKRILGTITLWLTILMRQLK